MLINDLIRQLVEIAEEEGNQPVNICIGAEADTLTPHIEPPYKQIWIKGWVGHKCECLYSDYKSIHCPNEDGSFIVQKELEL